MLTIMAVELSFRNFALIRRGYVSQRLDRQWTSWGKFCADAGIGTSTLNRILDEDPMTAASGFERKDRFAKALGFHDWFEMVREWSENKHPMKIPVYPLISAPKKRLPPPT